MSAVKVGLIAYSQGAPEVIVRLDKDGARQIRDWIESVAVASPKTLLPITVDRLLAKLRGIDLEERSRGG